ncbi:hypothetical protein CQJ94_03925 [Glycomyces fuscus]|nr:hypothetical protein CQJ94_03925 [Glycomyces fuscus]
MPLPLIAWAVAAGGAAAAAYVVRRMSGDEEFAGRVREAAASLSRPATAGDELDGLLGMEEAVAMRHLDARVPRMSDQRWDDFSGAVHALVVNPHEDEETKARTRRLYSYAAHLR